MKALKVSLLATAFGTLVWLAGLAQRIWPRHPLIFVFLLTLATYAVFMLLWPDRERPESPAAPGIDEKKGGIQWGSC